MTQTVDATDADRALKAEHRTMWALGDYPAVVDELICAARPRCWSTRVVVGSGQRVLDVAAGTGNVAIPAALAGATVVASDLTPELLDAGRAERRRRRRDPRLGDRRRRVAAVRRRRRSTSCCRASASCSRRTTSPPPTSCSGSCRPGGTIGLISWTPTGFIGQMFAAMKPYAPPPPPGAQPPPLWGDESHVRAPVR